MFIPIRYDISKPYQDIHSQFSKGIKSDAEYNLQLIKYGKSVIDVPVKSIPLLLITEVLNPFYIF